ncbi:hypothetical protein [Priestia megaterium]|uniref:hypothetical protein n=1 Tax=Priestia megaterium TaxID=1404 RepID=UPI0039F652AF
MKIRIVKASSPTAWYADRIGEVFEVVFEGALSYTVRRERGLLAVVSKSAAEEAIEHNSQLYRKVDRPVREGDTVLITKFDDNPVNIVRTVVENEDYSSFFDVNEPIIDGCLLVYKSSELDEYFVLEAIEQPVELSAPTYAEVSKLLYEANEMAEDIREWNALYQYNGKQYRKVKRKAAAGELVVVVEDFAYGKIGEVHTVIRDDVEYDALVTDLASFMNHSRYEVLEPVESTPTLTEADLIANLAQEVAELKRQLTNAQSDIADLEDRLDENEKDTEEVIGRINDLGDGAETAAVDLEAFLIELKEDQVAADNKCFYYEGKGDEEMAQFFDGKATGFKIAARRLEEALRNG